MQEYVRPQHGLRSRQEGQSLYLSIQTALSF
jgi:hypothetical protein